MNEYQNVRNAIETSEKTCPCNSWLKHWEAYKGRRANLCSVKGCGDQASDGAHVQHSNGVVEIVPMCHEHNCQFGKILSVRKIELGVNCNTRLRCGLQK